MLYLCFEERASDSEMKMFLFVVFDEFGEQKQVTLRKTKSLTNFLVHPSKKNVLFLVQENQYLEIHLEQGIDQIRSEFAEANRILQAAFSPDGDFLVEVRQFEGVQIWDIFLKRKIFINRDENFNLILDELDSDFKERKLSACQVSIEFMRFKDGRQSILM